MPLTGEARRAYDAMRVKGGPLERPKRPSSSRNGARARKRAKHLTRFVGVDGEGVTRPDGAHDYNLLSIGARSFHHPDGRALTFDDVAGFLWECHEEDPEGVMVGFFLGYDFAQWLRTLPEAQARRLLTEAGRVSRQPNRGGRLHNPVPFPVRWGGWEFDMLPNMRRFKLRPSHVREGRCDWCTALTSTTGRLGEGKLENRHPWAYVCDVGPFFQTSLLTAVNPKRWPEPVLTPEEYEVLEAGKAARSGPAEGVPYGTPVDPSTITYNVLENDVLARTMDRYNRGLVTSGVKLTRTQWHGPGQAAQVWLKQVAPDHTGDTWRTLYEWDQRPYMDAMASYFGGWFEIPVHGPVPGSSWDYDVNSAYPFLISQLPCLRQGHGLWLWGDGKPSRALVGLTERQWRTGARHRLVRATVRGSNPFLGAMLHRTPKGRVLRPHGTEGWYWWPELQAAKRAGLVDRIEVHEWWQWKPTCDCPPPFRAIADLYRTRLEVGKNSAQGRALRLVYNSAYGKMAQSVGTPLFSNPVYASLITSGCRTMILDAIATHPDGPGAVVMVATDGVYFTSRHPGLDLDPERLGAWDETELHDLTLFKPGVYWHRAARRHVVASRGVNERALASVIGRLDAQWRRRRARWPQLPEEARRPAWWPSTSVAVPFAVISPRQALQRNRWELCGAIAIDAEAEQSSWPGTKRAPIEGPPAGWAHSSPFYRSRVWGELGPSTPYDKRFGIELREGWAETELVTPDGTMDVLWSDFLAGWEHDHG